MDFIRSILCCCGQRKPQGPSLPGERDLLIPASIEPNISYSDISYLGQQRLQQRLGTIVRSKEGKMVNIGSHIPFNLHNQVLPEEGTISRSNSASLNLGNRYHHSDHYLHSGYGPSPLSHSRSPSPRRDDDSLQSRRSRFADAINEQPRPTPILNVRLVGYTAPTTSRGRARERGAQPPALPVSPKVADAEPSAPKKSPMPTTVKKSTFAFDDVSSIAVSWGD